MARMPARAFSSDGWSVEVGGMVGRFVDFVNLGQTVKTAVFEGALGLVADLMKSEPVLAGVLVVAVDTLELVDAQVQVGVDSLVMVMVVVGGVLIVGSALLILVLDKLVEEMLVGVRVVVDLLVESVLMVEVALLILVLDELLEEVLLGVLVVVDSLVMVVGVCCI